MNNKLPKKLNTPYYLPAKLKRVLSAIPSYPLTVIEAPSGFGKTTAVREYFKPDSENDVDIYWHTCFGEPLEKTWESFCGILSTIDDSAASYLRRLGTPTEYNLMDIAEAAERFNPERETFIVIDNFQYVVPALPKSMIDILASHKSTKLHIILVAQQFDFSEYRNIQNENIYHIDNDAFVFSREDTKKYFENREIALNEKELSDIYRMTEGWIAALNLQRINYEYAGKFEKSTDMDTLIKTVFWNKISDEEKQFLMSISILDNFNYEQARIMSGEESLPPYAGKLLDTNAFIRYEKNERVYMLHSLLQSYLKQEFDKLSNDQIINTWRLAGFAYKSRNMNYQALLCFLKIEDYDSIFNLQISGDEFTSYISIGSTEAINSIVENCPDSILFKYPKKLLVFAFELFMTSSKKTFLKLYEILHMMIKNRERYSLSEADYRVIAGELARLESFTEFNDISKMSRKHREALELLGGPATLYDWRDSWTFGQPSVIYLFWSKRGELSRELDLMDECLPYYYKLTYGHGTGAEAVMRAEAMLMSGDEKSAEALCHRALYLAAGQDQDSICYAAELILARIAILKGDIDLFKTISSNMNKRLLNGTEPGGQKIVDLAQAFLETLQGSLDIKEWLLDINQIKKNLYPIASLYGSLIYLNVLLIKREYSAIIGLGDAIIEEAKKHRFLLPQVYIRIFMAIANHGLGNDIDAKENLDIALDLAEADRVFLPFAEHGVQLEPLLKQQSDSKTISQIRSLSKRQDKGVHTIKSQRTEKPVLTQRELEVVDLAIKGFTNKQIAAQLYISVNTVKVLLKRVFVKLDIKSRAQLSDYNLVD